MTTATAGIVGAILTLATGILMVIAFPKLNKRSKDGWTFLFWSEVVSTVATLIAGGYISGIIGAAIGFYILFQIKSYYK